MSKIGGLREIIGIFKGIDKPNDDYYIEGHVNLLIETWASINPIRGNRHLVGLPGYGDELSYSHIITLREPETFVIDTSFLIAQKTRYGVKWWRVHAVKNDDMQYRFISLHCRVYEDTDARILPTEQSSIPNMGDAY